MYVVHTIHIYNTKPFLIFIESIYHIRSIIICQKENNERSQRRLKTGTETIDFSLVLCFLCILRSSHTALPILTSFYQVFSLRNTNTKFSFVKLLKRICCLACETPATHTTKSLIFNVREVSLSLKYIYK